MHNILCTTVIAVLAAGTLPALAANDSTTVQRVEITASRSAVAAAQAVLALRGEDSHYEMSNGRNLVVTAYGDHVEMRYGRRTPKHLRHDGQGNFVSRDGSLTLQFDIDARGEAQRVRLSAPATWF
jgi:hypothetical protein